MRYYAGFVSKKSIFTYFCSEEQSISTVSKDDIRFPVISCPLSLVRNHGDVTSNVRRKENDNDSIRRSGAFFHFTTVAVEIDVSLVHSMLHPSLAKGRKRD